MIKGRKKIDQSAISKNPEIFHRESIFFPHISRNSRDLSQIGAKLEVVYVSENGEHRAPVHMNIWSIYMDNQKWGR